MYQVKYVILGKKFIDYEYKFFGYFWVYSTHEISRFECFFTFFIILKILSAFKKF